MMNFVNPLTVNEYLGQMQGDFYSRRFAERARPESMILNLGPQHPSTHGVMRILLELDGEYILRAEPVVGYLHRGHEKMAEGRTAYQYMPNMGRVDYLHPIAWNWAYCGAVERLAGLEVPPRAEHLRVIACEYNRIASHLVWWGAFILDLGAFTPILYAFEDKEKVNDMLQIITGSRLTYNYLRFGGVGADVDRRFIQLSREFIPYMRERLKMYRDLVTDNIILRRRLEDIGHIDLDMCRRYGASGPVMRGTGLAYDVRRAEPYGHYHLFDFKIPVGETDDCMGRYLVRMEEFVQSLNIIEQAINSLPGGPVIMPKAPKPNWKAPAGEAYFAVEGGRGKTCVQLLSDGGKNPYRVKLRAPGFSNLSLGAEAVEGVLIADAIAILGSLDLVIPEIDR